VGRDAAVDANSRGSSDLDFLQDDILGAVFS